MIIRLSPLALAAAMAATSLMIVASSHADAATTHVRYADLDLSTTAEAVLHKRVSCAAGTMCWLEDDNLSAIAACRSGKVARA